MRLTSLLISVILSVTACPAGAPVFMTAGPGGDIVGIDGFRLGDSLSAPPAGYQIDPTALYGTTYVKDEQVSVAGASVQKQTQIVVDSGGRIVAVTARFQSASESDTAKIGAAVLGGLQREYGTKLQQSQQRAMASDGDKQSVVFSQSPVEIAVTVKQD